MGEKLKALVDRAHNHMLIPIWTPLVDPLLEIVYSPDLAYSFFFPVIP